MIFLILALQVARSTGMSLCTWHCDLNFFKSPEKVVDFQRLFQTISYCKDETDFFQAHYILGLKQEALYFVSF
jgi:hypothetical protein